MTGGSCHCGTVRFTVPAPPVEVTECHCSICTKLGSLCCYYPPDQFAITQGEAELSIYQWGDRLLDFRFCSRCSAMIGWRIHPGLEEECYPGRVGAKVGVNARLIDGIDARTLPRRVIDGPRINRPG